VSDSQLQEIICRAVVGRAESTLTWSHTIPSYDARQVLGVRIGRTSATVQFKDGKALARLVMDCDLWCGGESDARTTVMRTRCRCDKEVPMKLKGDVVGDADCHIALVGGPRSTGVRVDNGAIVVDFEATASVEVIALTRLWIKPHELEEFHSDTDWDFSGTGEISSPYGSH
jgi:hypothetical protein